MGTHAITVEEWRDEAQPEEALAAEIGGSAPPEYAQYEEPDEPESAMLPRIAAILLVVAAIGWIGAAGWVGARILAAGRPDLGTVLNGIATLSAPLALIGVGYLLLRRTSRHEAARFADTAERMRAEAAWLEQVLGRLSDRIGENGEALGEHSRQLMLLGDEVGSRLGEVSGTMRSHTDEIGRQSERLETAARGARDDMAVLLNDLPRAAAESQDLAGKLRDAGLTAHGQAGALEAALASLVQRGREAEDVAGGAAQRLGAHLARIEGTSKVAGERLEAAAGQMSVAVDEALVNAAQAVDEARRAIHAQSAAMLAMVDQGRIALERVGEDSSKLLAGRLDEIGNRLDTLGGQLAVQDEASVTMLARVGAALDTIEQRFAALEQSAAERSAGIGERLVTLGTRADLIDTTLSRNSDAADALIVRAETLSGLIRQTSREARETLPQALQRLEERVGESHAALEALVPQAARLATSAGEAAGKLGSADALLLRQATTIRALGLAAEERLTAIQDHAAKLEAAIAGSADQVRLLVDGAGPQLIDALLRVRETALQAADHARDAFSKLIPETASSLGEAARTALSQAFDSQAKTQLAEVSAASEQAVQSTQRATERLMRQMLTIADTTALIETRLAEARKETEKADEDAFSHRVALLIDALNSTAIDVTGMLSQEVADSAWAAYLKGDRGIFTRRAVRLIDAAEMREIQRLYEDDANFRDQLNRYVHDFEAMLRRVLASRDGSPLGITLLSSDMGKLYVALAQAIERLRA
ncbi:MAG: hypothetical protein JWM75_1441 [Sphingomonas bacterium]|nr:hypothetical protein [Sphingomonas bacterium]